jgi:hypothetical protein
LPGHPEIVAVIPVLDDHAIFDPEPVGLGRREGLVRRREDRVHRAVGGVYGPWAVWRPFIVEFTATRLPSAMAWWMSWCRPANAAS